MRAAKFLPCVFLCLLLSVHARGAEEQPDPQLKDIASTLVPEKDAILQDEPVYCSVTIQNNSKEPVVYFGSFLTTPAMEDLYSKGQFLPPIMMSEGRWGSGTLIAPGEKTSRRLLLSSDFKDAGVNVITAHSTFKPQNGNRNPNDVTRVDATFKITVLPADKEKMGALIDSLGAMVRTIHGSPDNEEEWDALTKLEAINDERVIPYLVGFSTQNPFVKNRSRGLAKFSKAKVDAAFQEQAKLAAAEAKLEAGKPYYDPKRDPVPKMTDPALKKAVEAGDALQVRQLVLQGADIRPFAKSEAMVEKYWAAPLDEAAVPPNVTIQVQKAFKKGEAVAIHIEFKNTSDITLFYNPTMKEGFYSPAALLLFDANKNCIGDLFESTKDRTLNGVGHSNAGWIEKDGVIRIDKHFGIILEDGQDDIVYPGIASDEKLNKGIVPGHYYLQVVYWLRSIAPSPDTPGTAEEKQLRKIKGRKIEETWTLRDYERDRYYSNPIWKLPLYRSNIVPVDVE